MIDVNSHLRADRLLGQLRQDGEERWLFVAQGKHDTRLQLNHWYTMTGREDMSVRVRGTLPRAALRRNERNGRGASGGVS